MVKVVCVFLNLSVVKWVCKIVMGLFVSMKYDGFRFLINLSVCSKFC